MEFRAETVGSLLRPAYLKEAREAAVAGRIAPDELAKVEDGAVDEAIVLQEEAGLDVVTDGEMRRITFMGPIFEAMDGFELVPSYELHWIHAGTGEEMDWRIPVSVTERLRPGRPLAVEEYTYAASKAGKPVKQTLPSPLLAGGTWNPDVSREAYPDPFELLADTTEIIREEARELAARGCSYIQLDAPEVGTWADPNRSESGWATGISYERLLSDGLDLLNTIPEGIDGVTFGLHLCKGNNAGHYTASGGYDRISRQVFSRLGNYDVFLLEYEDERSGGFEPLADCPDDKMVVLGLVSTKLPALEDPGALAARVDEAARYHPRERLALSPQCGFASVMEGNPVTEEVQSAKLRLVADLAHRLWPA